MLSYLEKIRQTAKIDIYSNVNATLISNPFMTDFPISFLKSQSQPKNKLKLFLISSLKFYARSIIYFCSFLQIFFYHKFLFNKSKFENDSDQIVLDIFIDVERVCKSNKFEEPYFSKLYPILDLKQKSMFSYLVFLMSVRTQSKLIDNLKNFIKLLTKTLQTLFLNLICYLLLIFGK